MSSKLSVSPRSVQEEITDLLPRRQMSRGHSAGQSAASGCNAACHDNTQSLLPISVFRLGRWNDRGLTVVGPALLRGEEKHTGFLWPNMSSLLWVHVSLLDSPSIIQKHQTSYQQILRLSSYASCGLCVCVCVFYCCKCDCSDKAIHLFCI